jgi:hypothetical protein
MMKRSLTLIAIVAICALGAAPANAGTFTGKTSQGRQARIRIDSKGIVHSIVYGWRTQCADGEPYDASTVWRAPFKLRTLTTVRDSGTYTGHPGSGYTSRITTSLRAHRVSAHKWAGRFSLRVVVRHTSGAFVTRCSLGSVTFQAKG